MTCFRGAKVCSEQSDYKFIIGLKVRIQFLVMLAWWRCTVPTPTTTWPPTLTSTQSTSTRTLECMCVVSFILCQRIVIHCTCTAWLKSELCPSRHPIQTHSWCVRFSLAIGLSFLFTFYLAHILSHSFHFFTHLKFVDNLRIPPKESMASIDETYLHTISRTDLLRQESLTWQSLAWHFSYSWPLVVECIVARGCCVEKDLGYLVELLRASRSSTWHFRRDMSRVHNATCWMNCCTKLKQWWTTCWPTIGWVSRPAIFLFVLKITPHDIDRILDKQCGKLWN